MNTRNTKIEECAYCFQTVYVDDARKERTTCKTCGEHPLCRACMTTQGQCYLCAPLDDLTPAQLKHRNRDDAIAARWKSSLTAEEEIANRIRRICYEQNIEDGRTIADLITVGLKVYGQKKKSSELTVPVYWDDTHDYVLRIKATKRMLGGAFCTATGQWKYWLPGNKGEGTSESLEQAKECVEQAYQVVRVRTRNNTKKRRNT